MTNPQIDRLLALSERARRHGLSMPGEPAWHIEQAERESVLRALHDYETWLPSLASEFKSLLAKIAELEGERDEARDVIREVIRAAGGAAHPECSMEFLKLAPAEVAAMKSLLAERDAASARVGVLEEALEPFAKLAGPINGEEDRPTYLESIEGKHGTGELYLGTHFGTDRYLTMWTEDFVRARLARGEG